MGEKAQRRKKILKDLMLANIPNFLSVSRILLTFIIIYMIFIRVSLANVLIVFIIAASTDLLDGQLARRFNWVSEFGRRTDMIADRFLWIGTAAAFVLVLGRDGMLNWLQGIQLFLLMTREIFSMPFAIIAFFSGNHLPHARYIAKVTTFVQAFALPALILSIYDSRWIYVSLPLCIIVGICGAISAMYYVYDTQKPIEVVKGRKR